MKEEFIAIGRGNADVIAAPRGGENVFGTGLLRWGEQLICPTIGEAAARHRKDRRSGGAERRECEGAQDGDHNDKANRWGSSRGGAARIRLREGNRSGEPPSYALLAVDCHPTVPLLIVHDQWF